MKMTARMILFTLIYFYRVSETTCGNATTENLEIAVRIVGGEVTNIRKYPFIVSIQRRHRSHICGGTYVAPRFILSAAHCMIRSVSRRNWVPENPRQFYAIAGSTFVYFPSWSSIQMELIDKILPHKGFRIWNMQNDIGLFRLEKPFRVNSFVSYVALPKKYEERITEIHSDYCTAIGWGRHIPETSEGSGTYLRHVDLPLIPIGKCSLEGVNEKKQICAGLEEGGRDACQGDSGGPLLCSGVQIGIVSWGWGCARPKSPGVYGRVDFYLNWINETILKNNAKRNNINQCAIIITVCYEFMNNNL